MVGRHEGDALIGMPAAAQATDGALLAQQTLYGDASQGNNDARIDGGKLALEIGLAGGDFLGTRIAVLRRTAFFHIADINLVAAQPHGEEDAIEKPSGLADEGLSPFVLLATWGLADEHEARLGVADPENDVPAPLAEGTAATVFEFGTDFLEGFLTTQDPTAALDTGDMQGAHRQVRRNRAGRGHDQVPNAEQAQILQQSTCLTANFQEILFHRLRRLLALQDTRGILSFLVKKKIRCLMAFMIVLAATLSLLLWPAEAFAWGIGIHLQLGSHILDKLHLLPAALQTLLVAHPQDFLYGCISADITIGKKFTHYLNHCHSWRLGRKILAASVTDRQKACAYGYITHLAADTIAHSYFVPFKMVRSFNTVMLNHAYWELRFEADVPREVWGIARGLARLDFRENDTMMRGVLADTIFSFNTNKRIFNSLLLLNRLQQWQKVLRSLSSTSRFELPETSRREYFDLACDAAESVLMHMDESPYWKADPTGERAISAARMIRKNLHLLWLEGKISDAEAEAIVNGLRLRFREGITRPREVLDLLSNA